VKYFQTVVKLDKTNAELMKPGVKLKAQILAGELKSVIVIPRSAAVKKDSGFVAFVLKGVNQFEPVPVTLGSGDAAQVVVTEGLEEGQTLALNPPDLKQDFSGKSKKSEGEKAK
jgi:multidrug efflux pump subunit AcrA (membrane-fusion protein)